MYPLIIAALLLILLGSWLLSVRHKLSVLDENAGSAHEPDRRAARLPL